MAITVVASGVAASPARAEGLASCTAYSSLITCAAADVGELCQGGGSCFAVGCASGAKMTTSIIYRCGNCPTIIADDGGVDGGGPCSAASVGTACVGGGTCSDVPGFCSTGDRFQCTTPYAGPGPTGPPAGESDASAGGTTGQSSGAGGSSSSGCDVAPRPPPESLIGLGLVVMGVAFFVVDRRRRRKH